MKLPRSILALFATSLLVAGGGQAQSLMVLDNFESYLNTNTLTTVWSNFLGSAVLGLETNIVCEGGQALRLKYSLAAAPNTNTIVRTFSEPQDWSTFNTITFSYGGTSGNSSDNVIVQILDHLGGVLGSFVAGGTAVSPCKDVAWDLSNRAAFTNVSHHTDLRDVQGIVLGVSGGTSRGSGTVYFDKLIAGNNGNLITNPGFHDLNNNGGFGDGWNSIGVQQFLNFLPNGNPGHATFYSDTTGNTGSVFWVSSPAISGTKYRLSVDMDCESEWHALSRFGVQFTGDDTTTVVTQKIVTMFRFGDAPRSYKSCSMIATVPPGVSGIRPWFGYTDAWRQSGASQRAVIDNAKLVIETNRVLSIFGASIHKGMSAYGEALHYTINGSYARSFGARLTTTMAPAGWRVVNQSVSGDNTTRLTSRFATDESPVGADVVFIGLSMGNEGLPGATNPAAVYNHFYTGITNLIALARSNNLLPIVGCGFPRDAYTTNEYAWLKKMDVLLNTLDVPTVNFLGATDNGIGRMLPLLSSGDGIHFSDAGHYELFLSFVPSVFDTLMVGKPTPQWSNNRKFARILADPQQPAPLSFTPSSITHSFTASFRVRAAGPGTVAAITLPGTTNHPTVEVTPTGLAYVAANGQMVNSGAAATDGNWHEVLVAHQYSRTQTWFYVDSVLAGTVSERLTPVGFVLGGPGNAVARPVAPLSADYENWFIHRAALTTEQVQAQFRGALQQASLEIYAPLDDAAFMPGGTAENRAQSLSVVAVNGDNVDSQLIEPIFFSPEQVRINFFGVPNFPYDLQRSTLPDFSGYSVLLTITGAPANGLVTFSDTNPPSPSGFYRLKPHWALKAGSTERFHLRKCLAPDGS